MSIASVLWIVAISSLVLGVAGSVAAALRHLGRSERWVWVAALVVTVALPFFPAPTADSATATDAQVTVLQIAQVMSLASESLPAPARVSIPWIPLVWALGSAATLVTMLGGAWTLARRRESWPRRRVDGDLLRVSDTFGPAVVGWIDPEIVLPEWALEMEATQRRLILRHENEHRWARDPLLLGFGVVCLAAAAWNPIAWLQFLGLRRAVEFDCDARVLASGASPRAYGRLLLSVQLDAGRTHLFAPALREPASFLERRLQTMTLRNRPVARLRVAGLTMIAAALSVVACETPRPTEAPPERAGVSVVETQAAAGVVERMTETASLPRTLGETMAMFVAREDGALEVRRGDQAQQVTVPMLGGVWRAFAEDGVEFAHVRMDEGAPTGMASQIIEALEAAGARKISFQSWDVDTDATDNVTEVKEIPFGEVVVEAQFDPEGAELHYACGDDGRATIARSQGGSFRIRGCADDRREGDVASGQSLTLRGMASIDATAPGTRPLIYVDGVRAHENAMDEITPDQIERIEVIKGTAAIDTYGEDASNGVIQIFLKKN